MDVLKYSVIMVLALLLVACQGNEPVGKGSGTFPTGDVSLYFELSRRSEDDGVDYMASLAKEVSKEMDIRIYLFRSNDPENEDSYTCISPYPGEDGQCYISVLLPADSYEVNLNGNNNSNYGLSYNCNLNIPFDDDSFYRFLAIGVRGSRFSESEFSEIDCEPGMKWRDVRIRKRSGQTAPGSEEIFSGVALSDKRTGSRDFAIPKGGSLKVEIELSRAVAGVMLCAGNVPSEIKSDFSWSENKRSVGNGHYVSSRDNDKVIMEGENYSIDRIDIIAVGCNEAFSPATSSLTNDYREGVAHLASINLSDSDYLSVGDNPESANDMAKCYFDGGYVYPARLADKTVEGEGLVLNRSSLYLAVYTKWENAYDDSGSEDFCYYPLKVIPVKNSIGVIDNEYGISSGDDGWVSADRFRFNLLPNHLYCLGTSDNPIDLSKIIRMENVEIELIGNYQTDVNIPF